MSYDIVTMEDCASNFGVFEITGSKGDTYTVTFSGSEGPAHCTCPAYRFSGAEMHCKHVARVHDQACFYNPQWHEAHPEPILRPVGYTYEQFSGGTCECGGPLVYVKRAV